MVADPRVQAAVARVPVLRRFARRDGDALMDLVAGFVHSQVLLAVVRLRLLNRLMDGPADAATLADGTGIDARRMAVLCDAACALSLMRRRRKGYAIARRGAALLGVPGLEGMILHHPVLYRDMADPVALLQGADTELSAFWPYVFGAGAAADPQRAATYSQLMTDSQTLVAQDTLARVDLSRARRVLDVGGGTGAFLIALGRAHPGPALHLFDLPAVVPGARARFAEAGLEGRATVSAGSFRDDPLPTGADVVTLVRILYDHDDVTAMALLQAVRAALPPDGRVVVSEPMTGGDRPHRAGDAYFAFYTLAMGTGRARAPSRITAMLREAGFAAPRDHGSARPFVTHVLSAGVTQ
ncbi:methyltransferase [Jannaschia sp. LMIT008]|uniref:methyltransferase n=1 Tax=Jannaschia maritima TaxID=3032585 RepID=UPI00281272E2|nr:methyltransferase [Jannaschia sp. LMIT008]